MTQALYAHMNNKKKKTTSLTSDIGKAGYSHIEG
jgi:hypothetical protein